MQKEISENHSADDSKTSSTTTVSIDANKSESGSDEDDDDDDFSNHSSSSGGGGSNIFSLLNLATSLFPASAGGSGGSGGSNVSVSCLSYINRRRLIQNVIVKKHSLHNVNSQFISGTLTLRVLEIFYLTRQHDVMCFASRNTKLTELVLEDLRQNVVFN